MRQHKFSTKDFIFVALIIVILIMLADIKAKESSLPFPPLSNDLFLTDLVKKQVDEGIYLPEEIKDGLNILTFYHQPLIRLISRPEIYLDKKVATVGYLRIPNPNSNGNEAGYLFLSKADGENWIFHNSVIISGYAQEDMPEGSRIPLSDFNNKYVVVFGTFSAEPGALVIHKIERIAAVVTSPWMEPSNNLPDEAK